MCFRPDVGGVEGWPLASTLASLNLEGFADLDAELGSDIYSCLAEHKKDVYPYPVVADNEKVVGRVAVPALEV